MKILSNISIKLKIWQIFILTLLPCVILGFIFLQPVLKNGLTGDDWGLLFEYKTYDPHPLSRVLDIWMTRGPYTTIQFFYIGFLESLFGINYLYFQIINILFKIFASITLFILISKIFKDSFLASISAIIFSIIHSSAGALQYVVKGTEYLGLAFMNLFFLSYYYTVIKNSLKLIFLTSVILFITYILSPIRLYPLYGLVFLIEIYLVIKRRKVAYFLQSFFRLMIFYLPVIFLLVGSANTTSGYLKSILNVINDIKGGRWYYLLLPLKALGYCLLGNDQLQFLRSQASLVGALILIVCLIYFVVWIKKGNKLDKTFLLFFGIWFAIFFLISTLAVLGESFNVISSLHWYLIVPSLGISIFISSLICSFIEQGIKLKKYLYLPVAFLMFVTVALVSYHEITKHFNDSLSIGTGASDQTYMQNQILNSINNQNQLNLIVYLEQSDKPAEQSNAQYYAVALNSGHFGHWFLYFKKPEFLGCTTVFNDKNQLRKSYKVKEREYFEADGLCAETRYNIGTVKTVYEIGDFRAFLFKDKKIFNITEQVLRDLRLGDQHQLYK